VTQSKHSKNHNHNNYRSVVFNNLNNNFDFCAGVKVSENHIPDGFLEKHFDLNVLVGYGTSKQVNNRLEIIIE
jgi:hypothetical protein